MEGVVYPSRRMTEVLPLTIPVLQRQNAMAVDGRECGGCRTPLDDDVPEWKKLCPACFVSAPRRNCKSCDEPSILDSEPAWRTLCGPCFADKSLYRECADCGETNIKPGVADYVKQCGQCWLVKRRKTHKDCPKCGAHLRCRLSSKHCRDCAPKRKHQ